MHLAGLIPALVLVWLQISVLAAISVAVSTYFSLVVNLPVVLIVYVLGNISRFAPTWSSSSNSVWAYLSLAGSYALPFLQVFDLRQYTILSTIELKGTQFEGQFNAVKLSFIWANVGIATLYAITFAALALGVGLLVFRDRELGGLKDNSCLGVSPV